MKIRQGFVSNSSSSSFVVAGFYLPSTMTRVNMLEKLYSEDEDFPQKKLPESVRGCEHEETDTQFCPTCGKPMWVKTDYDREYENKVTGYFDALDDDGIEYLWHEHFIGIPLSSGVRFEDIEGDAEDLKRKLGVDAEIIILSGEKEC